MNSTKLKKQQRQFFVLVGLVLLSFGAWKLYKDRVFTAQILLGLGTTFLLLEFIANPVAKWLFSGWMAFARILAKIQTVILLTLIYFTMIVPIAFFQKLSKKSEETYEQSARKQGSSWLTLEPLPESPDHYYRQF